MVGWGPRRMSRGGRQLRKRGYIDGFHETRLNYYRVLPGLQQRLIRELNVSASRTLLLLLRPPHRAKVGRRRPAQRTVRRLRDRRRRRLRLLLQLVPMRLRLLVVMMKMLLLLRRWHQMRVHVGADLVEAV